jgi:hypothetical protein
MWVEAGKCRRSSGKIARLAQRKRGRKRHRDNMDFVRKRRAHNVISGDLRSERNALRAFGHRQRLDHQQAEAMLLSGNVVSRTVGAPDRRNALIALRNAACSNSVYRCSSNTCSSPHACLAYRTVERGNGLEHKALQALPHQQMRECMLKRRAL